MIVPCSKKQALHGHINSNFVSNKVIIGKTLKLKKLKIENRGRGEWTINFGTLNAKHAVKYTCLNCNTVLLISVFFRLV